MINLRHNYPLLEVQEGIFEHYLQQLSQSYPLANHTLPPWGGASEDKAIAASWLMVDQATQALSISLSGNHALLTLLFAMKLTGKTIVTESFTYAAFKALADMLAIRLLACPMDQDGIDAHALSRLCEQHRVDAVYLQPTCQNPTCLTMPIARRRQIVELARAHGFVILEDDAYRFLHPQAPMRLMDLLPEQTFYIASLTKPFSPALKLAYLAYPQQHQAAVDNAIRVSSSGASWLLTRIASAMLSDQVIDHMAKAKQVDAGIRQGWLQEIFGSTRRDSSSNSYHVWLHLPEYWHADRLRDHLLEHGIDVSSGTEFAAPGVDGSHRIRFCIGAERDPARLRKGLQLLHQILYTPPLIQYRADHERF